MNRKASEIFSNNFYAWERAYRGHAVSDEHVPVIPSFQPFRRFNYAIECSGDGSQVPTPIESVFSFFKNHFKQLTKSTLPIRESKQNTSTQKKQKTLTVFRIFIPLESVIKNNEFEQFLQMLSLHSGTIAFEIVATAKHITLQFVFHAVNTDAFSSLAAAYIPSMIVQKIDDPMEVVVDLDKTTEIVEFAPRHEFIRPIKFFEHCAVDPFIPLFSVLDAIQDEEMVILQMLFHFSQQPWKEAITHALYNELGQPFFFHSPEMIPYAEQKCLHPMFGMILRAATTGPSQGRVKDTVNRVAIALTQSTGTASNQLQMLSNEKYDRVHHVADLHERTTHRTPFVVNSHELLSFVHLPNSTVISKKYRNAFTRTKVVPDAFRHHQFVLGYNNHAGMKTKVTIGTSERLRHTIITGSSGMGKSNLLVSMIREDMRLGNGLCVIDPHGTLIDTLLKYVPGNRINDIIVLDPTDHEFPFSLNVLKAFSEREKEVLASDLVAAFRKNSQSWGDGLNSIFANALSVFLYSSRGGTLAEVRRFLLDKHFRNEILETVEDPQLIYYWRHEFPLLRTTSVGSVMTRLDVFLRPKAIRNMVAQPTGFDFERLLNERKILLVKLPHGHLGVENAYILGSMLITKIYQAALARQGSSNLQEFFQYADEFHHFLSAATSVVDILSGARKFKLSLVAATQSLSQITESTIVDSILTNAATRICFRLGESDAKRFSEGFSSFTPYDLQNLRVGEAICRVDRPEQDFSLQVPLPDESVNDDKTIQQIINNSRASYCVLRQQVEQRLNESISLSRSTTKKQKSTISTHAPLVTPSITSIVTEVSNVKVKHTAVRTKQKNIVASRHRDIQTIVKKMAESLGFVATIEHQLSNGGQVDVLLTKNSKAIAVEISVATGKKWEVHNIEKCMKAKYDVIVSLSENEQQMHNIKEQFEADQVGQQNVAVLFFTLETFYTFLLNQDNNERGNPKLRGYHVNVSFEARAEKSEKNNEITGYKL